MYIEHFRKVNRRKQYYFFIIREMNQNGSNHSILIYERKIDDFFKTFFNSDNENICFFMMPKLQNILQTTLLPQLSTTSEELTKIRNVEFDNFHIIKFMKTISELYHKYIAFYKIHPLNHGKKLMTFNDMI